MNRRPSLQGFTLIEVLVALAVFGLSTYLIYGLIGSMRFNGSNMNTLLANQAIQDVMERTAKKFNATYGVVTAAEAPKTLDGYTWTVNFCQADPASNTCTSAVNLSQTTTTAYAYTAPATANLVRMTVTYTPKTAGTASAINAALELARP